MRSVRYTRVDVLTDRPLAGCPLAVVTHAAGLSDASLLGIARELGPSSTTVFLLPGQGGVHAHLRCFTPAREVPFAGHAVLGAAFVIGTSVQLDVLTLGTGKGPVQVALEREGARVISGALVLPLPAPRSFEANEVLAAALGVEGSRLPVTSFDLGVTHTLLALSRAEALAVLRPDPYRLAALPAGAYGVFAADGPRARLRVFAPALGLPEAPASATGAGLLAAHLVLSGVLPSGTPVEVSVGSELGRPSSLLATAWRTGDGLERLEVQGTAVIVGRGELKLLL
jgi:trans-2,3-dihydro-3-hydroxyanthranilate isomerase